MRVPKLPSVFKNHTYRSAKRFDYKPLYYNEAKEQLQERIEKIKKEVELEQKLGEKAKTEGAQFTRSLNAYRRQQSKTSNSRLAIILILLTLLAIWILKF
ncbi:MAG: hypothetical protein ACXITV_01570 [Luteibaculaceae bacterium]